MTPESRQQLNAHVRAIAELLHADARAQGMPMATLGELEQTVRHQLQRQVSPGIGNFLFKPLAQKQATLPDESVACWETCGSVRSRQKHCR